VIAEERLRTMNINTSNKGAPPAKNGPNEVDWVKNKINA
jgi:hypothetical protein